MASLLSALASLGAVGWELGVSAIEHTRCVRGRGFGDAGWMCDAPWFGDTTDRFSRRTVSQTRGDKPELGSVRRCRAGQIWDRIPPHLTMLMCIMFL